MTIVAYTDENFNSEYKSALELPINPDKVKFTKGVRYAEDKQLGSLNGSNVYVRYRPETLYFECLLDMTNAMEDDCGKKPVHDVVNDLEQRVLIVGNTDFLSNGEFATGRREVRNFNGILKHAAFYWLSHEELPVNTEGDAPIDRKLYVSEAAMEIWSIVFMVVIPVILALAGIIIWVRRRGR